MAGTRLTTRDRLLDCPACGKDIDGEFTVEVPNVSSLNFKADDPKVARLEGQLIGVSVSHNCTPGVTRGRGRPPGSKTKGKADGFKEGGVIEGQAQQAPTVVGLTPEEHRAKLRQQNIDSTPRIPVDS